MKEETIKQKEPLYKKGDWVRFYRNGILVIGQVEYTTSIDRWYNGGILQTDQGATCLSSILETRRGGILCL